MIEYQDGQFGEIMESPLLQEKLLELSKDMDKLMPLKAIHFGDKKSLEGIKEKIRNDIFEKAALSEKFLGVDKRLSAIEVKLGIDDKNKILPFDNF